MYLAQEDREGKEVATKISPGSTSLGVALVLAEAAATATLTDKDNKELESKAAAWLAAWKSTTTRGPSPGAPVEGDRLLLDRAHIVSAASVAKSLRHQQRGHARRQGGSNHGGTVRRQV